MFRIIKLLLLIIITIVLFVFLLKTINIENYNDIKNQNYFYAGIV